MMKKNMLILFLLLLILFISNVNAFMPRTTHKFIFKQSVINGTNSNLYTQCMAFPRLCYSGNVLNDISVLYYYTDPDRYIATHSPSFCRKLLNNANSPEQKACAIGGCLHQPTDLQSHNFMVPYAIRHSFIVNAIIHVFAEQKVDSYVAEENPLLVEEAMNDLGDYEKCKDLFVNTMLGDDAYKRAGMSKTEIDELYTRFINEIKNSQKTGYNEAFKTKSIFVGIKSIPLQILIPYIAIMLGFLLVSVLLVLKIIKRRAILRHFIALILFLPLFLIMAYFLISLFYGTAFNNFINFITPISKLVPVGDYKSQIDNAITNNINFFRNGESELVNTDASGFNELKLADNSIMMADYIIMISIIVLLVFYIWFLFKKNKIISKGGISL